MSNVIRLFGHIQIERPAAPTNVTIAEATVSALGAELERAIRELSKHFDAIDYVIDSLDDPEAREQQSQLREALMTASLELSQAMRKFPSRRVITSAVSRVMQ